MAYVKIPSAPGVYKDDTSLAAEGFWIDSSYIRFVRDRWQTRAGYEKATSTPFLGLCRGVHAWRDNAGISYTALGTHTNCYAFNDGSIYDITPVITRGNISVSFTTILSSAVVTADWTAHGMVAGQSFSFATSTVSAVGGVTIVNAAASITNASTQYIVVSVVTANQFTFTAAQTATSNAGPTAATVNYLIYLAPGLADSIGGSGYGTGGYGSGGYAGSNTGTLYARTWAADSWSQNLLMSPRGGGIYEWEPLLTATELVTNGDMSSATGWTQGNGWTIGAGTATAVASMSSDLSTSITMTQASWFVLEFDYTRSAGTLQPKIGMTSLGSALSAASAHVAQVFYTGTSPLKFTKDATFAGTVDNVSVKQLTNLNIVTNAPTQNTDMLVTAEFICMALGTVERVSGNFNAMHIRTSDQFGNPANTGVPLQTWTPTSSNQSTEIWLAKGSRIVGGMNTAYGVAVWTDTALYIGRYVADPNIVYRFDLVGEGCGLLGPNAMCIVSGAIYWMSNAGQFFVFAGDTPQPIESTCRRDVYDNLALVQQDKVYACAISAYSEAQWLYPDARDNGGQGTECSRYIKLNVAGNSAPCWDVGSLSRTAWIDGGIMDFPLAPLSSVLNASTGSYTGYLYYQEKGDSFDGSAMSWTLTQGAFDIGNGDTLFQISRMIPDFDDLMGNISVVVNTYTYPNSVPVVNGPYSVTATGQTVDFINTGRQANIIYSGSSAPCFARQGAPRFELSDTGMKF